MKKNLTAGVAGTQSLHGNLSMARGNTGRGNRNSLSTARLQWMKRLSSKRVRRHLAADMAQELTAVACDREVQISSSSNVRGNAGGIVVITKRRHGRTEQCIIDRSERAFTSPSDRSLALMGFASIGECLAFKADLRGEAAASQL